MRFISEMKDGQSGYALPWAVCEIDGGYYIHPNYQFDTVAHGTMTMYIEKKGGALWFYKEEPVGGNGFAFPRMTKYNLLPVTKLRRARHV